MSRTGAPNPSDASWDAARWQRLAQAFSDVATLPPSERSEPLRRLRARDEALAREVEQMLAIDAAFDTESPPRLPFAIDALLEESVDPPLPAGTRLGAYAIERTLGVGGMGRVYLAHRADGDVTQTVAIKCLRFRRPDPEFDRRFRRERRILARLNHPHVARFLDAGTGPDGQAYVVIEYVDGVPITQHARTLPLRARIELLLQVMDAVAYSHRQLVLHLDIKPGNVLVDAQGRPRLLDFGIAQALTDHSGATESETRFDARAFSISYAAPEQILERPVAMASDVYALGVLAYELLCDALPLVLAGRELAEVRREIQDCYPEAPSVRVRRARLAPDGSRATAWSRELRGDLDRIVLHALRKEPEARYATVDAFAADLGHWLAARPISLRSGQRLYRLRRFVARRRVAVALAAALVLSVAAGLASQLHQMRQTRIERDAALAQGRRAEAMNALLLQSFEAADPARNRGELPSVSEVLDRAARGVGASRVEPSTRVALLTAVSEVYRTLGRHDDSVAAAEQALQHADGVTDLSRARAWRALAHAQLARERFADAADALARAAAFGGVGSAREREIEAIERERVHIGLLLARGAAPEALARLEHLHGRSQQALGGDDPIVLKIGLSLAQQLRLMRRWDEGAAIAAAQLASIPAPETDPTGVRLLGEMARIEQSRRHRDDATRYARAYLDGVRRLYGEDRTNLAPALNQMAALERSQGRLDAALDLYAQALALLEPRDEAAPSMAYVAVLNNIANLHVVAGRFDAATGVAQRTVETAERILAPGHVNLAAFRITLAEALLGSQRHELALQQLRLADGILGAAQNSALPGVLRAYGHALAAESLLALERGEEARVQMSRGWPRLSSLPTPHSLRRRAAATRTRLGLVE